MKFLGRLAALIAYEVTDPPARVGEQMTSLSLYSTSGRSVLGTPKKMGSRRVNGRARGPSGGSDEQHT